MSDFAQFASIISKYNIRNPTDIFPIEKIPVILNSRGFFINRTRVHIERLIPSLQMIQDVIPHISEGPQPQLATLYHRVKQLIVSLISSVKQMDQGIPEHLQCKYKILLALGHLGQFEHYLRELTSPKAETLTSYIPSFLDCIRTVISVFRKTLEQLQEVEEYILPECEDKDGFRVDYNRRPIAQAAAALLHMTEEVSIDLNFLLQNNRIKNTSNNANSNQLVESDEEKVLKFWISTLAQLSTSVFANIGAIEEECNLNCQNNKNQSDYDNENAYLLINSVSPVISATPSLLSTISNIYRTIMTNAADSNDKNVEIESSEFSKILSDSILFMHLTNIINASVPTEFARTLLESIPNVYKSHDKKQAEDLTVEARTLFNIITPHIKANLASEPPQSGYLSNESNQIAEEGAIRDMLTYADTKTETACLAAAMVVRFFAATASSDLEASEEILIQVGRTANEILSVINQSVLQLAQTVQKTIKENMTDFTEKQLGELNYYSFNIIEVGTLSLDSTSNYCESLKKVISCFGALSNSLKQIEQSCANPKTQRTLHDLGANCDDLTEELAVWSHIVLLSFSTVVINHSELSDTTFEFCQWCSSPKSTLYLNPFISNTMKKMPEDLERLSSELHANLSNSNVTKFLTYDIGEVSSLINIIKQLNVPYNTFNKLVNAAQGESSSYDLLLSIISYAIPIIIKPLPEYVTSISVFLEFTDIESFTTFMNGMSSIAKTMVGKSSNVSNYNPLSLAAFCSIPTAMFSSSFSAIKRNQQYASTLQNIQETVTPSIRTFWNLATGISSRLRPASEAHNIGQLSANLEKILTQISSTASTISTPNLPLVNEGSVKLINDIQMRVANRSGTFRDIIDSILDAFKLIDSPDAEKVLEYLSKYMTEIDALIREGKSGTPIDLINAFTRRLADSVNDLLYEKTDNPEAFIDAIMAISASLAVIMENCGEPFLSEFKKLHTSMINNLKQFITSGGKDKEALRRVIADAERIKTIANLMKMTAPERKDFFVRSMVNLMRGINGIRTKSMGEHNEDIIDSIKSLERIMVCSEMFKLGSPDLPSTLEPLRSQLFTGKYDANSITKIIARLSDEIVKYRELSYEQIETLKSTDEVLDFIYNKAEVFRTFSTKLLRRVQKSCLARSKSMKDKKEKELQKVNTENEEKDKEEVIDRAKANALASVSAAIALNLDAQNIEIEELSDYLRSLESSITQGAGATFRSLLLAALKEKPITAHSVNQYGESVEVSSLLVPDLLDINNKLNMAGSISIKSQEEQMLSLRRFIRKMRKEFDNFINIIESPDSNKNKLNRDDKIVKECEQNKNDFESLKMKVISAISDLSNEVASLSWLATNSYSPEMYNDARVKVTNRITNQYNLLIQAGKSVLSKAVGDTASQFKKVLNGTKNELLSLIESAQYIDFSKRYPAEKVAVQAGSVGTTLIKLTHLTMNLIDHVVIKPDQIAASKLPDDYVLPTASSSASSQDYSNAELIQLIETTLKALNISNGELNASLDNFVKVTSDNNATSDTMLDALNSLKLALDKTIDDYMKVTVLASSDPLAQINIQNSLHALASSFNAVKEGLRSRLMMANNYQVEMKEAIDNFRASMASSFKIANDACTSVKTALSAVSQKVTAKDAVSQELEATANAIEELTKRLKAIEQHQYMGLVTPSAKVGPGVSGIGASNGQIGQAGSGATGTSGNVGANGAFGANGTTGANGAYGVNGGVGAVAGAAPGDGSLSSFVISNANPILAAAAMILKRAQEITSDMLKKYGKIENEQHLIRSAKELSDAAALLIFSAEIVLNGVTEESVFKVIAAAKIVKASVCSLVAQVLVKGGDPQSIMDRHVRTVVHHTDMIIKKAEEIVQQMFDEQEKKVKKAPTLMAQKLNLQTRISDIRKKLQEEERVLYKFRKRF